MGFSISSRGEALFLWDLGLQREQLERVGMWLALGGKDDRGEATGTRGVLGILKVSTKLELHTEKAEGRGLFWCGTCSILARIPTASWEYQVWGGRWVGEVLPFLL